MKYGICLLKTEVKTEPCIIVLYSERHRRML